MAAGGSTSEHRHIREFISPIKRKRAGETCHWIGKIFSRVCGRIIGTPMDETSPQPVTELLQAWSAGDEKALDRLVPLVYGELRQLAQRRMLLENPGVSLQPTALVNELYLRLVDARGLSFRDRSQFFALAAQMMRRILVDAARTRGALKRGLVAEET